MSIFTFCKVGVLAVLVIASWKQKVYTKYSTEKMFIIVLKS